MLNKPEDLKSILLYHVISGSVSAVQAIQAGEAETVQGAKVTFKVGAQGVMVNEALVTQANIRACSGIIHVIDTVLQVPSPVEKQDIVSIALADPRFETLVKALKAADLVSTLQGSRPFTVFAPTNDAFDKIGEEKLQSILADKETIKNILLYHLVSGAAVNADQASQLSEAMTGNGEMVIISFADGVLKINDATVIIKDIEASNGNIHVIDTVLMP